MTKHCRIYRPHIAWIILFEDGYLDHIQPDTEQLIYHLMQLHDITYDDIDVCISTEPIELYDVVLDRIPTDLKYSWYFNFAAKNIDCGFGPIFKSQLNITDSTTKLYIKVLPFNNQSRLQLYHQLRQE